MDAKLRNQNYYGEEPSLSTKFSDIANSDNVKLAATATSKFATEQVEKLKKFSTDGDLSVKTMAFFGGLAMAVTSGFSLSSKLMILSFLPALISFYTLLFGILACLLEAKEYALPSTYEATIERYAKFLRYVWGRGIFYFFAGSLQLSTKQFLSIISGGFMCFVGIMHMIVGWSASKKLAEARNQSYTDDILRNHFLEADQHQNGGLNKSELAKLLEGLGLKLGKNEIATTFNLIDKTHSGKITYDDFIQWWNELDHEINVNAGV